MFWAMFKCCVNLLDALEVAAPQSVVKGFTDEGWEARPRDPVHLEPLRDKVIVLETRFDSTGLLIVLR